MEITVNKEDLPQVDCGGGYRQVHAEITIDASQSPRDQRQAVIFETLSSMLSYSMDDELIHGLTDVLGDALDQLEGME